MNDIGEAMTKLGATAPTDLGGVAAVVEATAAAATGSEPDRGGATIDELLAALALLRWLSSRVDELEPVLIGAARNSGATWQSIADCLGLASRQAAERRYLRLLPESADNPGPTRDDRVRGRRDRRAGERAAIEWADDHAADLRGLAGQVAALRDLDQAASDDIGRLHHALGATDARSLPDLLGSIREHLRRHPELVAAIDTMTARVAEVRRHTQRQRDDRPPGIET